MRQKVKITQEFSLFWCSRNILVDGLVGASGGNGLDLKTFV